MLMGKELSRLMVKEWSSMARKRYKVVAVCDYRDRHTEYVCAEFSRKADAKRYVKEECYDTPSRVHIIREE